MFPILQVGAGLRPAPTVVPASDSAVPEWMLL